MKISSYLLRQAENDLSKLIQSQEIQYKEGLIGCCKKYFLIFPNDHHKYHYNPNKLISDTLKKKVFNYLYKNSTPYTNMSKPLNEKTTNTMKKIHMFIHWLMILKKFITIQQSQLKLIWKK